MSPRTGDFSAVVPRHDHSRTAEGGAIADPNVARLDETDTQTFVGSIILANGGEVQAALELDDLNTTPITSTVGAFVCLLGAEAVTDGREWRLPDRVGSASVTPLESRYRAVRAVTGTATLTEADDICTGDATGAAFTVTLPTASGKAGRTYVVKKIDASANAVTVDGNGAETIDGAASVALSARWDKVTVVSDGTNWLVVA